MKPTIPTRQSKRGMSLFTCCKYYCCHKIAFEGNQCLSCKKHVDWEESIAPEVREPLRVRMNALKSDYLSRKSGRKSKLSYSTEYQIIVEEISMYFARLCRQNKEDEERILEERRQHLRNLKETTARIMLGEDTDEPYKFYQTLQARVLLDWSMQVNIGPDDIYALLDASFGQDAEVHQEPVCDDDWPDIYLTWHQITHQTAMCARFLKTLDDEDIHKNIRTEDILRLMEAMGEGWEYPKNCDDAYLENIESA